MSVSQSKTDSSSHIFMPHYDIFLSHSSQDKAYVDLLQERLINRGYRVWYDKTHISWGDSLRNEIEEGLRNSHFGIIVLSHHYLASEWTPLEFNLIIDNGRIFPLLHNITINEIKTEYFEIYKHIKKHAISSEQGLDYVLSKVDEVIKSSIVEQKPEFTKLLDLLAAKEWNYADLETFNLVNKKGGILGISQKDLDMLNHLWFRYSDEHYGFRIQQEIYQSCYQSNRDRLQSYYRFCDRVEWGRDWTNILNYSLHPDTPKGHFPALAYFKHNLSGQASLTRTGVEKVIAIASELSPFWYCAFFVLNIIPFVVAFRALFSPNPQNAALIMLLYGILFLPGCGLMGLCLKGQLAESIIRQRAHDLHKFFYQ